MYDLDYYLLEDERYQAFEAYLKLMKTQFVNAGYEEAKADAAATNVLRIETALAKAHITREMRRIPVLNYHMMAIADLPSAVAPFNWELYFSELGAGGIEQLNVSHPEPVKAAIAVINREPLAALQDYLSWKVINSAAGYLSDAFVDANFEYYGKALSGSKELRPRWRRSIDVNRALGGSGGSAVCGAVFLRRQKRGCCCW